MPRTTPEWFDQLPEKWTGAQHIAVFAAIEQIVIQLQDPETREIFAAMYGQEALDELLLG